MPDDAPLFLRFDVKAEPCVDHWIAWDQLIPPASASMHVTSSHIPIMESYVASPETHQRAAKDPRLSGGPWVDYEVPRVEEIRDLLRATRQGPLVELSAAIQALDELLRKEAKGSSLEPLYPRIPAALRGYVELVYDLNNSPAIRFFEGLLYRSNLYDRTKQALSFSPITGDRRAFQWSTPVLPGADNVYMTVPFDDERIDRLFETDLAPATAAQLDALDLVPRSDVARLQALFTPVPPPTPVRYAGDGVRVRYFGHACVLIETRDVSILIDPFVSYTYPEALERFSLADLPAHIDYVLITHCHNDHIEIETLLRLRHRIGMLVVPHSAGRRREDASLRLMLGQIGFKSVRYLEELEQLVVADVRISAIPFIGEHCDLDIQAKSAYLIEAKGRSILFAADSCNVDPELYVRVRKVFGKIDVLFLGMECDGAPLSWGYGALLTQRLNHKMDQTRRFAGSNSDQALALVRALEPDRVFVYAMGQEPWLNHVLGLNLKNATHKSVIESKRFLGQLGSMGIAAEMPFAKHELVL
jgi:L-ascorbate metabolism protein UlaG (beta-lactamase superfamily)